MGFLVVIAVLALSLLISWVVSPGIGMFLFVVTVIASICIKLKGKGPAEAPNDWPRQGMPQDFIPTHLHDNIALDAKTGRVWVRHDGTGQERVFTSSEITGWSMSSESVSNAYGRRWIKNVCLDIQTKDLDRPIWKARFKRFSENKPTTQNQDECSEWFQRLEALFNHGATQAKSGS